VVYICKNSVKSILSVKKMCKANVLCVRFKIRLKVLDRSWKKLGKKKDTNQGIFMFIG